MLPYQRRNVRKEKELVPWIKEREIEIKIDIKGNPDIITKKVNVNTRIDDYMESIIEGPFSGVIAFNKDKRLETHRTFL